MKKGEIPMKAVTDTQSASTGTSGLAGLVTRAEGIIRAIAHPDLVSIALRLALAVPYWKSGVLKWDGFLQLAPIAPLLFENEFKLHLPGGPYDFPMPHLAAFGAGLGEIILPVLLVLGLGTRFAAFGLLAMTAIIQITIPGGWPLHLTWAAMALAIMMIGGGRLSADGLLFRRH